VIAGLQRAEHSLPVYRAALSRLQLTRSALREFVTTSVTVDAPSDVLDSEALGLSLVGMAAAGAAFCASAGATMTPHKAPPSAAATVHLVMNFSRTALEPRKLALATMAPRWRR
jgi:hypothetical protein